MTPAVQWLIAINVAVWLFYQVPNLERSVMELAYHPCEVEGSCSQVGHGWLLTAFTSAASSFNDCRMMMARSILISVVR